MVTSWATGDLETVDATCARLLEDFRSLDDSFGLAYVT